MMKIFFGDIAGRRLTRLQYLGDSLLVLALLIGFVFALIPAIGAGLKNHYTSRDHQHCQRA